MNKIALTAGVSVLSTLAVVGGTLGVLANIPSTKDKINISWEQTDLIGKNQENISNLKNEIKEKDNQILGQQVTIEELNQMLAGPESFVMPENLSFKNGIIILNSTNEFVLFSSFDTQDPSGFWKLNKLNGELTQIVDLGYYWSNILKMSDGTSLAFSYKLTDKFLLLDESYNLISVLDSSEYLSISTSKYITLENDNYLIFGLFDSNTVYAYNKKSKTIQKQQSLYSKYSCVFGDYFINSKSSSILSLWNLKDNVLETIETDKQFLPILTKKGVYLLSSTTFSKLDVETKTITVVQDGLSVGKISRYYTEIDDGVYLTSDTESLSVCYIDTNLEIVKVLGKFTYDKFEKYKFNENLLLFYNAKYFYSYDLISDTYTNYINNSYSNYLYFGDKYIAVFASSSFKVIEIGVGEIFNLSSINLPVYTSFEDLGEGKYKFISDSVISVYDLKTNTLTIHSLIIE